MSKKELCSRIYFLSENVTGQTRNMLEPRHCYKSFEIMISKGFNILEHCTNNVMLVLLLDMFELCQHSIAVVGKWILDSYFEHAVPLTVSCLHKCFIKIEVQRLQKWVVSIKF